MNFHTLSQNILYPSAHGSTPTCSDTISSPIDYVHWDNPNALCDRLRVLVADREHGFTGHDREIKLIIKELRAAKIIY